MEEPQEEWLGDIRPGPAFASGESGAGGSNDRQAFAEHRPRLHYGNTSRFGMVKGSIAARKATAATVAAATVAPARGLHVQSEPNTHAKGALASTLADTSTDPRHQRQDHGSDIFLSEKRPEGSEPDDLIGPMGSFNELPKVSSAADLIRTASHDRSSHSVSQARGLRRANVPTAYAEVTHTGYYRPSDRIGRLYTSTAASLTPTSAKAVTKATATLAVASGAPAGSCSGGNRGGLGAGKVVTAPFAAESRDILQTLALQSASLRGVAMSPQQPGGKPGGQGGNQSPSPTGPNRETFGSPRVQKSVAASEATTGEDFRDAGDGRGSPSIRPMKDRVVISSAQDTRTQLREKRSPPRGKRVVEVATSCRVATEGGFTAKDFRSWNPPCLGNDGCEQGVTPGSSSGSCGDERGGAGASSTFVESQRQKESISRYWAAVEGRIVDGSPNALGAGAKSPLFELPPVSKGTKLEGLRIVV